MAQWQLPLHAPLFPHNGQAAQQRDARAKPAVEANAVPDAAVMMTVIGQQGKLASHKTPVTMRGPAVGALHIVS